MQQIRPVSDLRNNITDITRVVTQEHDPVILTKNGYGHMVLMSYEEYGCLTAKQELYRLIDEGLEAEKRGETRDFREAMSELREDIENERI